MNHFLSMRRIGEIVFLGAAVTALALYWLTVPEGLPWNESVRLACAYLGECGGRGATTLPTGLHHSIWGFYVRVFGGPVALSVTLAALAAGLIASIVNRYFGWRFAACAALVWIFMPRVWNSAITGERGICLAAMAVIAAWVANAIVLSVTRKARTTRAAQKADGGAANRGKVNRIAGWVAIGASGLFAVVSATFHDYRLGEAASAYARHVVEEAGNRVILLNGVCDEQVRLGVGNRCRCTAAPAPKTLSFVNTEVNRSNIVAWVKREWPSETNLWMEAEIGPMSFAEEVMKVHPERFYSMMGHSTTIEKWEARWEAMKPYLASKDPFVPAMRRMFAYEGNYLANALIGKNVGGEKRSAADEKRAWNLYYRIFTEIHPKNPAACVNLNMMLRQGYKVDESTRQYIESEQADYVKLLSDRRKAQRVAERISHFGPVMRDQKAYEELRERVRKKMAEFEKKGDKTAMIPDLKTLEEWHPEMMKAFHDGEYDKAASIARAILARKAWRGFVPAYMVTGETMHMKGDWVSAESFLRVAAEAKGTAAPPPFVLNDYADALMHLGKLDEAEKAARRAVKESDEKTGWVYRWTLAQILEAREKKAGEENRWTAEIRDMLTSALKHAPKEAREKIRTENKEYLR